jgi:Zn-dependent M28 family amino/carboxypeptidase
MRRMILSIVLVSTVVAAERPVDYITQADIKAHMVFLASDRMAGRDAASPEAEIAADYIASEFMRMGLKPVGDRGSYFQNFDMIIAPLDRKNTSLRAKIGTSEKQYELGHDFNWARQSANPTTITAPVVFTGYGVNAPEYGYNDFAGVDVRGKIVIALAREPQGDDPQSRFKGRFDTVHSYVWYKIEQARKAGAAGLLLITEAVPRRKMRLASAPTNNWRPTPEYALAGSFWDIPVFTVTQEVANQFLAQANKTVASAQQAIDSTGKPSSFEIPGVTVTMTKAFTESRLAPTHNVVGLIEGSDPKLKDEIVVVSGHYDHVGIVGGRIYRGADDNASGTIGTIEIANAFVRGGVKPKRSILFICYDAEERGLLGAFYYVDHPIFPLEKTVANLNMDMIGRDEESANWPTPADGNRNQVNVVGTLYNPQLRQIIETANHPIELKLDFKTDEVDPEGWFSRSDHFCFAIHGVPMVLFNTGEQRDYHTENDTWDRINYPKMEKIVRLIYLTAENVASSDQRLKFTP